MHLPRPRKSGDTLIGIIIAMGIFMILSQAVISLAFSVYDTISYSRARISARHIALESMEIVRNAPYDDVGTVGGIPTGIFTQSQSISRNGQNYTIRTRVNYIDDEFDGVFPDDTLPTDYKRVRIDVSWGGLSSSGFSEVSLVTDVSPRGIETTVGGGTLSVLVFDSNGQPVPQAEVTIVSSGTNPPVNATYYTSDTGHVVLPGAPACNTCYQISVTKDGMSEDRTYSVSEIENPVKPLVTVIESELTEVSFAIDTVGKLNLSTVGSEAQGFAPLPGQIVRVYSEKIIGTDGLDDPVYKFDQDVVTDSLGNLTIEALEWGNYYVVLPSDSTMTISGMNPSSPLSVTPAQEVNLQVSLTSESASSLLVYFKDPGENPLASVAATLKDGLGFEATASSGLEGSVTFGQVFFGNLTNKVYTLIATASGFLEHKSDIPVTGDTNQSVIFIPN